MTYGHPRWYPSDPDDQPDPTDETFTQTQVRADELRTGDQVGSKIVNKRQASSRKGYIRIGYQDGSADEFLVNQKVTVTRGKGGF